MLGNTSKEAIRLKWSQSSDEGEGVRTLGGLRVGLCLEGGYGAEGRGKGLEGRRLEKRADQLGMKRLQGTCMFHLCLL